MTFFVKCFSFPGPRGLDIELFREFETVGKTHKLPNLAYHKAVLRAFKRGSIRVHDPASWSVQYAGSGKYFGSPEELLDYLEKRFPRHFKRWALRLDNNLTPGEKRNGYGKTRQKGESDDAIH